MPTLHVGGITCDSGCGTKAEGSKSQKTVARFCREITAFAVFRPGNRSPRFGRPEAAKIKNPIS
jgi:hypothetical protein